MKCNALNRTLYTTQTGGYGPVLSDARTHLKTASDHGNAKLLETASVCADRCRKTEGELQRE